MDFRSRERFVSLLTCAVGKLCKNGLIDSELFVSRVDGLLGITLSNSEVFLVNISECFHSTDNFGKPTQYNAFKLSTKTSASLPLTQSNATGRAGKTTTAAALTHTIQTVSKRSPANHAAFFSKPCTNPSFQTQFPDDSIKLHRSNNSDFVQHLATTTVDANTATYESALQNEDQTCTFIKVEKDSSDGLQAMSHLNEDCLQKLDELNFQCKELSISLLGKLEPEPVEENLICAESCEKSFPINVLQYDVDDDKTYIVSSSFGDPGDEEYTSISPDFLKTDSNISYDGYSQPIYPLSSSSEMTASNLDTIPALVPNKQLPAWQCKHFAPRSQSQRLEPRKRWKYHYDAATLKECIELVRSYKMSQREAERVFQIPRTTIQLKLAQMYPKYVAPPRHTFTKRNFRCSQP